VTPFGEIMRDAVQASPNAIGGAFAASDGEMVDGFSTIDAHEWAVITAHYGVVMAQLTAMFNTWHYGSPEYFICHHAKIDIVVHAVDAGYFALMALTPPANLAWALDIMKAASRALKKEMS
jgi:hypothetical protein